MWWEQNVAATADKCLYAFLYSCSSHSSSCMRSHSWREAMLLTCCHRGCWCLARKHKAGIRWGKKNQNWTRILWYLWKEMYFKFSPFLCPRIAKCCSCSPVLWGMQKDDLPNAFLGTSRHHGKFLALLLLAKIIKCVETVPLTMGSWAGMLFAWGSTYYSRKEWCL